MDSRNKKGPQPVKEQIDKNATFMQSLGHALEGIGQLLIRERNMRFHFLAALVVISVGIWRHIGRADWLWIVVAIFIVVMAEFVNTMVEAIVDLVVGDEFHPLAKIAKDVAAGAVVFAVVFAIAIGFLIFQPYFFPALNNIY